MSLLGMPARNHPQQVARGGTRDDVDDRGTTAQLFANLSALHGPFTVDVAASPANTKCARYYTRATDGLAQSWAGERVWCNPPYSAIEPWVTKAWAETAADIIVMLLPNNRCEQGWWQRLVEPYRDLPTSPLRTTFLAGRPRFLLPGETIVGTGRPPFGCVVLVWTHAGPYMGPDVTTLLDGPA